MGHDIRRSGEVRFSAVQYVVLSFGQLALMDGTTKRRAPPAADSLLLSMCPARLHQLRRTRDSNVLSQFLFFPHNATPRVLDFRCSRPKTTCLHDKPARKANHLTPDRFRWGRNSFGPGFAVETQDKYRLGWLSLSSPPTTGMVGGGGEASDSALLRQEGAREAARTRRRSWTERRSFFGLGRRNGPRLSEVGAALRSAHEIPYVKQCLSSSLLWSSMLGTQPFFEH